LSATENTGFNPITIQLFSNLFSSVAEEMGIVLGRTAYSANIKERRDYSCAIFDADLRVIAEGSHIPVHLGAMPLSAKEIVNRLSLNEGDVVIANDPFAGGTHLPDITLLSPVYIEGSLVGYVASRAHHSDVGSKYPGSMGLATSVNDEGVRIKPVKLVEAGSLNEDFLSSFLAQVRNRSERLGDLKAQLAANNTGVQRFSELHRKYGTEIIDRQIDNLILYTKRQTEHLLASIPDGVYEFEDYLDDDGCGNENIRIKTTVIFNGCEASINFEGSDRQVKGCVNATLSVTLSAVQYAFKCLLPPNVPANHGTFYPIDVAAPEASIVNASYPAAVAAGNVETSQRIVDVVLGALSKAIPDRIPAASQGTMNNISFGFTGDDDIERTYYETIGGGMGASDRNNGLSGVQTHMTNTLNTPIEALEMLYPLRIKRYGLRKSSGGKGNHDGGDGIVREYEVLSDATVSILSERRSRNPYGTMGGESGMPGRNSLVKESTVKSTNESTDELAIKNTGLPTILKLNSKTSFKAYAGDIVTIETPGGGGYGFFEDKP
jgi:N-methylhydantoinase B/oxoprolinase/acetone carboxylase alpha subunit